MSGQPITADGPTVGPRYSASTVALAAAAAAAPAACTAYLAFRSGGYFAGAPAIVAVALAIALVLRLMTAPAPFAGFGPALITATAALGCFVLWTLLSTFWSHAPAEALVAFDRALMYWLALVLFGSLGWTSERLIWAVRLLAATMVVVAICGLVTRLLPEVHSVPVGVEADRLSFPLSYWNGLGVFVAVAIALCCGLATRREEPVVSKVLAAAVIPILAATLYFTFSRGAVGALAIGLVAFFLLAARREMLTTAAAIVPPAAVVVLLCLGTHQLSTGDFAMPMGISEGKDLAWQVVACAVAAGLLRLLTLQFEPRLARVPVSAEQRRRAWTVFAGLALIVIVIGLVAGSGKISSGFEKFTESNGIADTGELQSRFTNFNNNGRIAQWNLALDDFGKEPLHGTGAGTFARLWAEGGNGSVRVVDSHSLYLGVMAELGLVGIVLLLIAILTLLVVTARRIFDRERVLYAALFGAMLIWAVHAGFDWDWQLPATGFFFFALGGMAIAARPGEEVKAAPWAMGRTVRLALSLCALALVVSPALMAISQGKLNAAVAKLEAGDCGGASSEALSAIHVLSVRPEPYQVLGLCDALTGQQPLAVKMYETAVARDEGNWESWYGLALVKGANGKDPRPAARKAYELAPHEPLAVEGARLFKGSKAPREWERRAEKARLPIY